MKKNITQNALFCIGQVDKNLVLNERFFLDEDAERKRKSAIILGYEVNKYTTNFCMKTSS